MINELNQACFDHQPSSDIEMLCIGHFCHDLNEGAIILGGTASYCSALAASMGIKTGVLTSVGADFQFADFFNKRGIQVHNKLSKATTVFENIYDDGQRVQFMYDRSDELDVVHLPEEWVAPEVVKFCLIADEINSSFSNSFESSLKGGSIQGWLRRWDGNGKIYPKMIDWQRLNFFDIVFMSRDDLEGFEDQFASIVDNSNILVMTNGKFGVDIFHKGQFMHYPSIEIIETDPTGAGDIFASSFLLEYAKSGSLSRAAAFAHSAASFVVERKGVNIPCIENINYRFANYLKKYGNLN